MEGVVVAKRGISGEDPVNKKPRLEAGDASRVWAPGLFDERSVTEFRKQFENAQPYKHVVIDNVCDHDKLKSVREQLIGGLTADFKETDIFKVFQTGDLGNLARGDGKDSSNIDDLLDLRASIYSDDFRNFVRGVTGCPALSAQVDCSCNIYPQGGHLLCHDDVIGTRCVSYIIYFTDPDNSWTHECGGALELYPVQDGPDGETVPVALPSNSLLPAWNRIVFFQVTPGVSFHSVQEVFSSDDHRLSISGWFHAAGEPDGAQKASLKQLKAMQGRDTLRLFSEISCESSSDVLPNTCRSHLSEWVNPAYLDDESIDNVYKKFISEGSIQLQNFILPSIMDKICNEIVAQDESQFGRQPPKRHDLGIGTGWEIVGPPHKQRYLRFKGGQEQDSCGSLLKQLQQNLFQSPDFACLLYHFTGAAPNGVFSEVRRFRPGLDYTVAHCGALSQDTRLDAVLCVVNDRKDEDDSAWAGGEVGGYEAYLLADEDEEGEGSNEAADVYKLDEDQGGLLSVSPACNTLNLVLRDQGLMRFVKYVGAAAPGSRWDIAAEYRLEGDEGDAGEGGQAGGSVDE